MVSLYDMSKSTSYPIPRSNANNDRTGVPLFLRALERSRDLLKIAEKHCQENSIDPKTLMEARLAPDMHPLRK